MIYTNSIEGYCNKPLTEDQIQSLKHVLHERAKRKIIWLVSYALIMFFVVMTFGGLIACAEPPVTDPHGNQLLAAIGFSLFLSFAVLVGGMLLNQAVEPYVAVTLAIHEIDMASSPEFLDEVDNHCFENLSSPLARKLAENIQKSGRNMLVFEKNLINKLTRI